ncbi:MAG: dihydrolipoyllysine-residue acetyltransferase [Halioglobus sp.]
MAKQQVTVPDIGGAEDAEVIEILVAVGDEVELEQGLIVLESDKASMEIPSTVAGTVTELLVSEGDELSEGAPIVVMEVAGEGASPEPSQQAEPAQSEPPVVAESQQESTPTTESEKPGASTAEPATSNSGAGEQSTEVTVTVPDIGTDDEVDLIEIVVKVGDQVNEGDSLVVLESDKASMEVPSSHAGEVLAVLVAEGQSVKQGDSVVTLRSIGQVSPAATPAPTSTPEPQANKPVPPANTPASTPAVTPGAPAASSGQSRAASGKSAHAGPAVRKLARELGVTLEQVTGSGPRQRILKEDLHEFVQTALSNTPSTGAATSGSGIPAVPEVDFAKFGEVEITKRSKLDKLTAANMHRSWLNVPHVTQFDDADITDLEAFRATLKAEAESRGTKITPMPFILKACAVALRDNPKFCTSLASGGEELVYKDYIHIGMAVDTPAGLMVPVLRDVDKKTIWELASEVIELAGKARDRKLSPQEMQGGCFSISSLGNIGGRGFTPIVNTPEVGILGVSRAQDQPVWNGQAFEPRRMLPLSLSYDHRVINGGDAGRFLTQLASLLSDIRKLSL